MKITLTAKYEDQDEYNKTIKLLEALGWKEISGKAILNSKELIYKFESKLINN